MDRPLKTFPSLLRHTPTIFCGLITLVAGLSLSGLPHAWAAEKATIPQPIASVTVSDSQIEWQLEVKEDYKYVVLSIGKPDGNVIKKTFAPGQPIIFSLTTADTFSQEKLDDGRSAAAKKGRPQPSDSSRQNGPGGLDGQYTSELGVMPASPPLSYSYYFTIKDGAILVPPKEPEPPPAITSAKTSAKTSTKTSAKTGKSQSQPKK